MMDNILEKQCLAILLATSLGQVLKLALETMVQLAQPQAAVLLLWDEELDRYTIGGTWLAPLSTEKPAAIRRRAIQHSQEQRIDAANANWRYVPLDHEEVHIGTFFLAAPQMPFDAVPVTYQRFIQCVSRAIYTESRLNQGKREHAQLESEHNRLEQLLHAVEKQQHTIDRLLTNERQLSASLEAKVEERTAALRAAQTRLVQQEKLAVIGQLASSLAHELNNPLQAIQSGLGLVMDDLAQNQHNQVQTDLAIIQEELERIQVLFNQMLDFYRPVSYARVRLDINAICEGVRVLLRKKLQESNVTMTLDLTSNLPPTCGDSNQIKQVLINLILNATEAMTPEGGNIVLCTDAQDATVRLHVIDQGPGIAEEHMEHLFEPLFTTKTRGLGLGLAISQTIAQRHGGELCVTDIENQGTTLTLTLPVQDACHDT